MRCFYIVLLCLFSLNFQAQNHVFLIELVDANVGRSWSSPPSFYSTESNDSDLNQIFENHNVTSYETVLGFYFIDSMVGKNGLLSCDCNPEEFIQDLLDYDSVVAFVAEIDGLTYNDLHFYNGLRIKLASSTNGTYQSLQNGVVVTNNIDLNQVFDDFGVRVYEIVNSEPSGTHELVCDCDAILLKEELENLPSVISLIEFVEFGILLSVEDSQLEKTEVYPNPFKTNITIKTDKVLKTIELYDILGKRVINTNTISEFESKVVALKSGIYILKLTDIDGNTQNNKIIKE